MKNVQKLRRSIIFLVIDLMKGANSLAFSSLSLFNTVRSGRDASSIVDSPEYPFYGLVRDF